MHVVMQVKGDSGLWHTVVQIKKTNSSLYYPISSYAYPFCVSNSIMLGQQVNHPFFLESFLGIKTTRICR